MGKVFYNLINYFAWFKGRIVLSVALFERNFLQCCLLQVKTQLHNRLQELQPLPEMLKTTELKLHDTEDRLIASERKNGESTKMIADLSAKVGNILYSISSQFLAWHKYTRIIARLRSCFRLCFYSPV